MDLNGIDEVIERPDRGSLAGFRPGDAWLGGGTWLFSEPQPGLSRLIDLRGFGWAPLAADADGLTVAATCTIAELERWSAPPGWRAAALVPLCCRALLGSFKVWNGATVGGNICLALPAGPMTALAAALDATCRLWGPDEDRALPAAAFVTGDRRTALRAGELLREIRIPAEALRRRAAFRQISLTPQGRSGALLIGTLDEGGAFRLTVTGSTVRPLCFPYPAPPAADALLSDLAAIPDALVFDDVHGRPAWRRAVTAHLAGEILDELAAP
ncbi:FAD-binding molybdopterin dehydrogenase [Lichenibacterium minor]|uniref:FAD-binding molybdopterin dehydrogenase n=1 Tax=Lichenibacterium minor TaxID=2316528 RepID=A0A4Q2U8H4_9HYPH|nr:FAD binding domain-containing protein [Lichenibacterium minor]RYC33039.1 FAD-binding molybdopterin dehydrogenase [Lichenibacterium minor]